MKSRMESDREGSRINFKFKLGVNYHLLINMLPMRIKKATLIIVIVFLIRVLFSCCDCQTPTEYQYSYDYFSVYNLDNSGASPTISETNKIPKEAYGIRLDFSFLKVSSVKRDKNSMFPEASASDCECPPYFQYIAKDTISSIDIITINKLDEQHPANSSVADLFKILLDLNYITLTEFINQPETIFNYKLPDKKSLDLFLMQIPESYGEQIFKIEILMSDSRLLTMTTNPVILE